MPRCHVCGAATADDESVRAGFGGHVGPVCPDCAVYIDSDPEPDDDDDDGNPPACSGCRDDECECGGLGPDFIGADDDDDDGEY